MHNQHTLAQHWAQSEAVADASEAETHASSTEDFWMFFSFAMLLLVFVLMNYVKYLNTIIVTAPEPAAAVAEAASTLEGETMDVYIVMEQSGVAGFRLGKTGDLLPYGDWKNLLSEHLASLPADTPVSLSIHADGNSPYQHIFDASYAIQDAATAAGLHQLQIELAYEAAPIASSQN